MPCRARRDGAGRPGNRSRRGTRPDPPMWRRVRHSYPRAAECWPREEPAADTVRPRRRTSSRGSAWSCMARSRENTMPVAPGGGADSASASRRRRSAQASNARSRAVAAASLETLRPARLSMLPNRERISPMFFRKESPLASPRASRSDAPTLRRSDAPTLRRRKIGVRRRPADEPILEETEVAASATKTQHPWGAEETNNARQDLSPCMLIVYRCTHRAPR